MGLVDNIRASLWKFLMADNVSQEWLDRLATYQKSRDYYAGNQRRQLISKAGQADDNLVENYAALVVERSISMLLGDGVTFELPDETAQQYLDDILEANHAKTLFYDAAQNAAIYGTGYLKIVPGGVESKRQENLLLPRLIVIDPRWMTIETRAEDIHSVTAYEMTYMYQVGGGEEVLRKERTQAVWGESSLSPDYWIISSYQADNLSRGELTLVNEVIWEYEFPPIVHWKNLPQANERYGRSDLEDVIDLQDRINFVSSNISKILRYHAHPKTWLRGGSLGKSVSWGADEMVSLVGENAEIKNLEMQTDLESSRQYRNDLKAALFDISRTVDFSNMKDKVGQLTNFGLRVLYNDSLDKNSTKRDLFGEALLELIHRLLVLQDLPADPGKLIFPDPLPQDQIEVDNRDAFDLDRQLVSKRTISTRRGYDYDKERERILEEKAAEETVGSIVLQAFERGAPKGVV